MGQSYLLGAPEGGEQRLLSAVEKVDAAMCKIRDAGKVKARDRIAVLAALNLAFDSNDAAQTRQALADNAAAKFVHNESGNGSEGSSNDPRLQTLVHKLDQALAGDGQLL